MHHHAITMLYLRKLQLSAWDLGAPPLWHHARGDVPPQSLAYCPFLPAQNTTLLQIPLSQDKCIIAATFQNNEESYYQLFSIAVKYSTFILKPIYCKNLCMLYLTKATLKKSCVSTFQIPLHTYEYQKYVENRTQSLSNDDITTLTENHIPSMGYK
jgi:hypothetical protein